MILFYRGFRLSFHGALQRREDRIRKEKVKMKKRLIFLVTAVVMIFFVCGIASADPEEDSTEV